MAQYYHQHIADNIAQYIVIRVHKKYPLSHCGYFCVSGVPGSYQKLRLSGLKISLTLLRSSR